MKLRFAVVALLLFTFPAFAADRLLRAIPDELRRIPAA